MLPDKIEHCIVFMNYWDVSGVFWSFSKCKIKIPHLPADPSTKEGLRDPKRGFESSREQGRLPTR